MSEDTRCVKRSVKRWAAQSGCQRSAQQPATDWIARECPVALVYNGLSHAVMMASPADIEHFAVGFSFTEGIVDRVADIYDIRVQEHDNGFEVALSISSQCFMRLKQKQRTLRGNTGCGICGVQSLAQMQASITPVQAGFCIVHSSIDRAVRTLSEHQPSQALTGALHGAVWCDASGQIIRVCEDVGRHNALDKLIGVLLQTDLMENPGFLLISSRASYEMVQKATRANIAIMVAVSAPTSLAVSIAEQSQLTLVGFARANRHVIYSQAQRITG